MVEARADGSARAGQARGMHQHSGFDPKLLGDTLEGAFQASWVEAGEFRKGAAQMRKPRLILRDKVLFGGLALITGELIDEVEIGKILQTGEDLDLFFAGIQSGFDVGQREPIRIDPGAR